MENTSTFYPVLAAIAAYLVGSLSFAVIVSKLMGLNDPRTFGSKNPGATNVLRSGNKSAAILTLVLDALKGYIPVALVQWFGKDYGLSDGTVAMVGIAAFLGHLYPVFFKLRAVKALPRQLAWYLACIGRWGLLCVASFAIIVYFFAGCLWHPWSPPFSHPLPTCLATACCGRQNKYITLMLFVMAMFLMYRHGANLTRLIKGTEPKLGDKKARGSY